MKKLLGPILLFLSMVLIGSVALDLRAGETTFKEQIDVEKRIITESTDRIKKDKNDAQALYARGTAYFHLGQISIVMYGPAYSTEQNKIIKKDFEDAAADFTAAIKIQPDLMYAYIMRGMAYGQMGLSYAAIADFTHVIAADPKNGFAYYARGREYWARGEYDKAKEDYDKAVELDPQWKDNFYP